MDALRGHKTILLDTSIWIYHLEQHPRFGGIATKILSALESGEFHGIASELILTELLVRPLKLNRQDIADEYELLLSNFPNLTFIPVDREILLGAATLRAFFKLRTPDAILFSTALKERATAVISNDTSWRKVSGLVSVILLNDLES